MKGSKYILQWSKFSNNKHAYNGVYKAFEEHLKEATSSPVLSLSNCSLVRYKSDENGTPGVQVGLGLLAYYRPKVYGNKNLLQINEGLISV